MRIAHVFRAPVGGLFRHVIDLAREQAARGHEVGIFCDSNFAGDRNEDMLSDLARHLSLGVTRMPMQRNPHWSDIAAFNRMGAFAREVAADVIHGHGSKGGLYARLGAVARSGGPVRAYTPHGGSLNYKPGTLIHRTYMAIEHLLEKGTDVFLFESNFIAERFRKFVCETDAITRVVLNGLYPHELEPVEPYADAADFLYIGEYRFAKGIDTLLSAMAMLAKNGQRRASLVLVGQGPDEKALRAQVLTLGLVGQVHFHKPMAAREAFRLARTMVVPSRFESMPYVVIEAAGARMPLISTDVGGISEIFGKESGRLIPADNVAALTAAMQDAMTRPRDEQMMPAMRLQAYIDENFSVAKMATTVLAAYAEAADRRKDRHGHFITSKAR